MDSKTRYENMLFEAPSTYIKDFHKHELTAPIPTTYKSKEGCLKRRPPPLQDVHTMSKWKGAAIPFSLLHKPRDIVGTNPWKVQERFEDSADKEREKAQKTRPRVAMTPAVSMDDIENPRARTLLCQDMYTSDMAKHQREAVAPYANVQAPFAEHPAPSNPIFLPKLKPPMVSPEWRMETVHWDNKQLRAHCDSSKEFWLKIEVPKCIICDQSAAVTAHRNMLRQNKRRR